MIHKLVKVRGADFCDDQFPVISTIGRGPKGDKGDKGDRGDPSDIDGAKVVLSFDTVEDMQAATDLEIGMICHTSGFYAKGDNGAAYYLVASEETSNGMDVLALANGLFATLLLMSESVTPEMFGARADGMADDAEPLQRAIDLTKNVILSAKTYCTSKTINVIDNTRIVGSAINNVATDTNKDIKGTVLKYIGDTSEETPVLFVSNDGSMTPIYPTQGVYLDGVAVDGNDLAGFGIYITFAAYTGWYGNLYAQRCTNVGIVVAQAWSTNFGRMCAWYDAIGIVLGIDVNGGTHGINQCTFNTLVGHSCFDYTPSAVFSQYAGTGIVARGMSASTIESVDVEQNQSCGLDIVSRYGCTIDGFWGELNARTVAGIALKSAGSLRIGTLVTGVKDELVVNTGKLDIGVFESIDRYYPFNGSRAHSIRVGTCTSAVYTVQDLPTWTALKTDFMVWSKIEDLASNVVSTAHPVIMPEQDTPSSLVLVPKNSVADVPAFVLASMGSTLSVRERSWAVGTPFIMNNYNAAHDYTSANNCGVSVANNVDLRFDLYICSIRYFYNENWRALKEQL